MNCEQVRELLSRKSIHDTSRAERAAGKKHMVECEECQKLEKEPDLLVYPPEVFAEDMQDEEYLKASGIFEQMGMKEGDEIKVIAISGADLMKMIIGGKIDNPNPQSGRFRTRH